MILPRHGGGANDICLQPQLTGCTLLAEVSNLFSSESCVRIPRLPPLGSDPTAATIVVTAVGYVV